MQVFPVFLVRGSLPGLFFGPQVLHRIFGALGIAHFGHPVVRLLVVVLHPLGGVPRHVEKAVRTVVLLVPLEKLRVHRPEGRVRQRLVHPPRLRRKPRRRRRLGFLHASATESRFGRLWRVLLVHLAGQERAGLRPVHVELPGMLVAPGVRPSVRPSRRLLPLRFRGQPFPDPCRVRVGVVPVHSHHRLIVPVESPVFPPVRFVFFQRGRVRVRHGVVPRLLHMIHELPVILVCHFVAIDHERTHEHDMQGEIILQGILARFAHQEVAARDVHHVLGRPDRGGGGLPTQSLGAVHIHDPLLHPEDVVKIHLSDHFPHVALAPEDLLDPELQKGDRFLDGFPELLLVEKLRNARLHQAGKSPGGVTPLLARDLVVGDHLLVRTKIPPPFQRRHLRGIEFKFPDGRLDRRVPFLLDLLHGRLDLLGFRAERDKSLPDHVILPVSLAHLQVLAHEREDPLVLLRGETPLLVDLELQQLRAEHRGHIHRPDAADLPLVEGLRHGHGSRPTDLHRDRIRRFRIHASAEPRAVGIHHFHHAALRKEFFRPF